MRTFWRLTAVLALVAPTVLCSAQEAGADSMYSVVAGADIVRLSVTPDPPMGADQPLDPGWSVTEARLTPRSSTAFASSPFPGQTGGAPPYPLTVSSEYPSVPNGHAKVGGVLLEASSGSFYSHAVARDTVNRVDAEVAVNPVDHVARGQGKLSAGVVNVNAFWQNLGFVDGLRSIASVTRAPDGELKRSSHLTVGIISISGHVVAVPMDKLESLSSLPGVAELAKQGIELAYLGPVVTEHGIMSAALQISWLAEIPGYGKARVTAELGRTWASVTNRLG